MRPLGLSSEREVAWERWLLGAALCAFIALAFLEATQWRPGFARTDESDVLSYLQQWREGSPMETELLHSCLYRHGLAVIVRLAGPTLTGLHAETWLAMLLECWMLFRLGAALLSRRAALWAVLASLVAANTFLRSRSLLAYSVLPMETLGLLLLMPLASGRLASAIFGAAAALLLADYEAAVISALLLFLFWMRQPPGERPTLVFAIAGFSAGIGWLTRGGLPGLGEYAAQRAVSLPNYGAGFVSALVLAFKGFFLGLPQTTGHMGVKEHGVMAAWALPFALGGVWLLRRRGVALLSWVALGLLPILSGGGPGEPNRLIVAWPALCLLAGAGIAFVLGRLPRASGPILAFAWLTPGAAYETRAYQRSLSEIEGIEYASSQAVIRLAAAQAPGTRLCAEFDFKYAPAWRYVWASQGGGGETRLFLFRGEMLPGLKDRGAALHEAPVSRSQMGWIWFKDSPAPLGEALARSDDDLQALRKSMTRFLLADSVNKIKRYLKSKPEPLAFTTTLELAIKYSSVLRHLDPELVWLALHAPLASASAPLWVSDLAARNGDQALAATFCTRAQVIDSRVECQP